jgi:hypothetical protein
MSEPHPRITMIISLLEIQVKLQSLGQRRGVFRRLSIVAVHKLFPNALERNATARRTAKSSSIRTQWIGAMNRRRRSTLASEGPAKSTTTRTSTRRTARRKHASERSTAASTSGASSSNRT